LKSAKKCLALFEWPLIDKRKKEEQRFRNAARVSVFVKYMFEKGIVSL